MVARRRVEWLNVAPSYSTRSGRSAVRGLRHLIVDPAVVLLEAFAQRRAGLPAEQFEDPRVVGVAAAHTLRCVEEVVAGELDARDVLDDVDHLVDRDEFARADV